MKVMAERAALLMRGFEAHLAAFQKRPPFNADQLAAHRATIGLRLELGSVSRAVRDDRFLDLLYRTLKLWRMGVRKSRLVPLADFARAIRKHEDEIVALEQLSIDAEFDMSSQPGCRSPKDFR